SPVQIPGRAVLRRAERGRGDGSCTPGVAPASTALCRGPAVARDPLAGAGLERRSSLGLVRLPGRPGRGAAPLAQAALILPWVFAPIALAVWSAARSGPTTERRWFLLMLAAPTIALFTLTPLLGSLGLPHWPMPGWLLL